MQTPIIYLLGATGKLGSEITNLMNEQKIAYTKLRRSDIATPEALRAVIDKAGVILDVSLPDGTNLMAQSVSGLDNDILKGVVIGVTGHSAAQMQNIYEMSKRVPTVLVSNFSKGIFLLDMLLSAKTKVGMTVAELAQHLGFESGIFEAHHSKKVDAPSGTAKTLAKSAHLNESKIVSQRVGHIVGYHEIVFSGESEDLRLSHTAHSRKLFAAGAVDIAKRLLNKAMPPGIFDVAAVMGE